MPSCLVCHSAFEPSHSWHDVLLLKEKNNLCYRCENSLAKIIGPICVICGRSMDEEMTCADCLAWESSEKKGFLIKNRSVFHYNDHMKDIMNQFKFRGDIEVIQAFSSDFNGLYKKEFIKTDVIVPIPLSMERLYERGFNQAEAIASVLQRPLTNILLKSHQEKQSKKGKLHRLKEQNSFSIYGDSCIRGKHILLVDDIYTTGTTLRNCAAVLLSAGACSCSSLTLIRS
ncbi:ComF family protein [Bacillus suaedaesalsae]|uniref:ComF family protein n=1 Tax=Bacillus suaedaesalsae TaxID=2810349 RepID=A0ABS2DKQ2_9BACI|nr:ComF family protein [Bacillus suaedaesalsae]MBM6619049.1 ComF family protein [Bacillus suaedaesalsae]